MVNTTSYTASITLSIGNGWWSTPYKRIQYSFKKNVWCKAVMPLKAFFDCGGTPSWNTIRYIHFSIGSLTNNDYNTVYIDGIHFSTWNNITETTVLDEKMLPNFVSFLHRWEKIQSYQGTDYASLYSCVPVAGSSFDWEGLESETLAQVIFGLLYAFDYSQIQYFLDLAQRYTTWLLKFQYLNESSQGYGGFRKSYFGGDVFSSTISPRNGWILGTLSWLYHYTSNSTILTSLELLKSFIVDVLWDEANNWFDYGFNINTQTVVQESFWGGMNQGCYTIGCAMYYYYISQNTTVKNIVDDCLNKGLQKYI